MGGSKAEDWEKNMYKLEFLKKIVKECVLTESTREEVVKELIENAPPFCEEINTVQIGPREYRQFLKDFFDNLSIQKSDVTNTVVENTTKKLVTAITNFFKPLKLKWIPFVAIKGKNLPANKRPYESDFISLLTSLLREFFAVIRICNRYIQRSELIDYKNWTVGPKLFISAEEINQLTAKSDAIQVPLIRVMLKYYNMGNHPERMKIKGKLIEVIKAYMKLIRTQAEAADGYDESKFKTEINMINDLEESIPNLVEDLFDHNLYHNNQSRVRIQSGLTQKYIQHVLALDIDIETDIFYLLFNSCNEFIKKLPSNNLPTAFAEMAVTDQKKAEPQRVQYDTSTMLKRPVLSSTKKNSKAENCPIWNPGEVPLWDFWNDKVEKHFVAEGVKNNKDKFVAMIYVLPNMNMRKRFEIEFMNSVLDPMSDQDYMVQIQNCCHTFDPINTKEQSDYITEFTNPVWCAQRTDETVWDLFYRLNNHRKFAYPSNWDESAIRVLFCEKFWNAIKDQYIKNQLFNLYNFEIFSYGRPETLLAKAQEFENYLYKAKRSQNYKIHSSDLGGNNIFVSQSSMYNNSSDNNNNHNNQNFSNNKQKNSKSTNNRNRNGSGPGQKPKGTVEKGKDEYIPSKWIEEIKTQNPDHDVQDNDIVYHFKIIAGKNKLNKNLATPSDKINKNYKKSRFWSQDQDYIKDSKVRKSKLLAAFLSAPSKEQRRGEKSPNFAKNQRAQQAKKGRQQDKMWSKDSDQKDQKKESENKDQKEKDSETQKQFKKTRFSQPLEQREEENWVEAYTQGVMKEFSKNE